MFKKILTFLIVAVAFLFILFVLRGSEDTWLCTEEGWVKHGVPSAPMPTEPCGQQVSNFWECADQGNAVMESYPRQCRAGDVTFVEDIGNELEKTDLIRIDTPRPNTKISSPLVISGQAVGTWFFEADFPVLLMVGDEVIAEGYATAQSDWMTENFVNFVGELEFKVPPGFKQGTFILVKDNPSDLRENDDQLEVPVLFN